MNKELWFRKWEQFYKNMEEVERQALYQYLRKQLRKGCQTYQDFLKLLNMINSAEKGKLMKDVKVKDP
tara:strand:+ start:135 stop:338 length:204 start_codon:yes stop_codon:yes gene_type:complete